ncbi:DinB family protein [Micrococcus flavus]|uniref:DinB-like domain-containing protein n=3 Tax=Micrococcus TaxID=1269 RepID=A0A4Y8WX45_9MICC|nr:DinB family protein [Micrococcus flavus]MBB4882280.1 hypothetical protein [Micrococcus flavus]PZP24061.1 MAG: aspartate/tyrosine/aromatic aminotransferase [Kocuria rhizophila]TFH99902.1 DinB family protein [Micrococcus flavus]GGK49931.1 hypothetical protein GCM10007073_16250 [Micrococcus flavus]
MDTRALLTDAARRPLDLARPVLDGLTPEAAHTLPGDRANSIAWLLWHAARQMDVQTSALSGERTVWAAGDWAARLGVDRESNDFGFGDDVDAVRALRVTDVAALGAHLEACVAALVAYVATLSDDELDDVVDPSYTPPVTRGVRLVSIIDDAAIHLGQAAYARGLVDGWSYGV